MNISSLAPNDMAQVIRLHRLCLPNTTTSRLGFLYMQSVYEQFLAYPKHHFGFVMREQDRIVGAITITNNLSFTSAHVTPPPFSRESLAMLSAIAKQQVTIRELWDRLWTERTFLKEFPQPYATILTLFVDPEFRRRGIGESLLKKSRAIAVEHQMLPLYVDTESSNTTAIMFYQQCGFERFKEIRNAVVLVIH